MTGVDSISFGARRIGAGEPVLIIAEIGVNHEGDAGLCRELVDAAAAAGADAVKLQSADPDEHYTPSSRSHAIFSAARLSHDDTADAFERIRTHCLEPFTTCGDPPTLEFIESLDPAAHKISSGMMRHHHMLKLMAVTGRPLLMSTGMANLADVDVAVRIAREAGARELAVMQCTSLYPAPPETLDLAVIGTYRHRYRVPVGFSDHSEGHAAAALSVAAGACCIEKHLTLDRTRQGFDHAVSLDPNGFRALVDAVRAAETMVGIGVKQMGEAEARMAAAYRRYVVARRPLAAGHRLGLADVGVMRVGDGGSGIPAERLESVVGRVLARPVVRFGAVHDADLV